MKTVIGILLTLLISPLLPLLVHGKNIEIEELPVDNGVVLVAAAGAQTKKDNDILVFRRKQVRVLSEFWLYG